MPVWLWKIVFWLSIIADFAVAGKRRRSSIVHLQKRRECNIDMIILHTVRMDEEKSKLAGLAQEKWFWLGIIAELQWLVKGTATLCTCRKEKSVIRYDLTAAQCLLIGPSN